MAELLIVVAIIAVLVAIAIPIFTAQLEKSREATDLANLRAAYAECSSSAIAESASNDTVTYNSTTKTASKSVTLNQTKDNWEGGATPEVGGVTLKNAISPSTAVTITVTSDGAVTFKQGETDLKN